MSLSSPLTEFRLPHPTSNTLVLSMKNSERIHDPTTNITTFVQSSIQPSLKLIDFGNVPLLLVETELIYFQKNAEPIPNAFFSNNQDGYADYIFTVSLPNNPPNTFSGNNSTENILYREDARQLRNKDKVMPGFWINPTAHLGFDIVHMVDTSSFKPLFFLNNGTVSWNFTITSVYGSDWALLPYFDIDIHIRIRPLEEGFFQSLNCQRLNFCNSTRLINALINKFVLTTVGVPRVSHAVPLDSDNPNIPLNQTFFFTEFHNTLRNFIVDRPTYLVVEAVEFIMPKGVFANNRIPSDPINDNDQYTLEFCLFDNLVENRIMPRMEPPAAPQPLLPQCFFVCDVRELVCTIVRGSAGGNPSITWAELFSAYCSIPNTYNAKTLFMPNKQDTFEWKLSILRPVRLGTTTTRRIDSALLKGANVNVYCSLQTA